MAGFYGSQVKDPNYRLRFFLIVFTGIISFGIILSWRSQLLIATEYQEMPTTHLQIEKKQQNLKIQQKLQNKLLRQQLEE